MSRNIERLENSDLVKFARQEIDDFRIGKIPDLSSALQLGERFDFTERTSKEYLRLTGVEKERKAAVDLIGKIPLRSRRARSLSSYVRQEIEMFRSDQINRLPNNFELMQKFDYKTESGVKQLLWSDKISQELKRCRAESRKRELVPSKELAWILAVLSEAGSVFSDTGLRLNKQDSLIQQKFIKLGERIFERNAKFLLQGKNKSGAIVKYPSFFDKKIVGLLGDLRKGHYPQTIREKHQWLFENPEFIKSFVEGLIDARSVFSEKRILFGTSYPETANFIIELLTRIGIKYPKLSHNKYRRNSLYGVAIFNHVDKKTLANQIHSVLPEKEAWLEFYRKQNIDNKHISASREELISEWKNLNELLGRIPNSTDIDYLVAKGKTKWSSNRYTNAFGKTESEKSFPLARQTLTKLCTGNLVERKVSSGRKGMTINRVRSVRDLIGEYKKARVLTLKEKGRIPTSTDLVIFKRDGVIAHSRETFSYHFGDGSLKAARGKMEEIIVLEEKKSRSNILIEFVGNEIESFKRGEIDKLSTYQEIAEKFGYADKASFYSILKREGLTEMRNSAAEQSKMMPSENLAWMLAVMSGGGYNNTANGHMTLGAYDEDLIRVFSTRGGELFKKTTHTEVQRYDANGKPYIRVRFISRNWAKRFGDLRRDRWPQTIYDKHSWIFRDQKYIWSFIQGIVDVRGMVDRDSVFITTQYPNVANFISELLVQAGVERPKLMHGVKSREGITGVGVYNSKDLFLISKNIKSAIEKKEKALEEFRQKEALHTRAIRNEPSSTDEVLFEWRKLTDFLGHSPRAHEIARLKREDKTKFSTEVYISYFGRVNARRSFSTARRKIEEIMIENL